MKWIYSLFVVINLKLLVFLNEFVDVAFFLKVIVTHVIVHEIRLGLDLGALNKLVSYQRNREFISKAAVELLSFHETWYFSNYSFINLTNSYFMFF